MSNHARGALLAACIIIAVLVIVVAASGGTFGQRCDRLYPDGSALQRERCVTALSRGVQP